MHETGSCEQTLSMDANDESVSSTEHQAHHHHHRHRRHRHASRRRRLDRLGKRAVPFLVSILMILIAVAVWYALLWDLDQAR